MRADFLDILGFRVIGLALLLVGVSVFRDNLLRKRPDSEEETYHVIDARLVLTSLPIVAICLGVLMLFLPFSGILESASILLIFSLLRLEERI